MPDFRQNAVGTGIAQAFGEGATATVTITGFTSEQIAPLISAAVADKQKQIMELARDLGTTQQAIVGFLTILEEEQVPDEELAAKLVLIADRHVSMLQRLEAFDSEDPDAREYLQQARAKLAEASSAVDYDAADDLLCKAEEAQDCTLQRMEKLEWETHQELTRLRRTKVETRLERGRLSLTRLDHLAAAAHFHAAISSLTDEDQEFKPLAYFGQLMHCRHTAMK